MVVGLWGCRSLAEDQGLIMEADIRFDLAKIVWKQPFAPARYTSDQLQELTAIAQQVAAACGPGYEVRGAAKGSSQAYVTAAGRGRVTVVTVTGKAQRIESREHRLARYGSSGR